MTQAITRWVAPATVKAHYGHEIGSDWLFFTAPPPEIGDVYTAFSGWRGNTRDDRGLGTYFLIAFAAALAAVCAGFVLYFGTTSSVAGWIAGTIAAVAAGYGTFRYQGRNNAVSYTAQRGVARYVYDDSVDKREKGEVFLFENAVELRTRQTRNYTNGVYTGTDYNFTWTGTDGRIVFKLAGRYSSEKGEPRFTDAYYYARAAEFAWSRHLLQFVNDELNRSGAFRFNLRGQNCVVAGPGYLELYVNGQQVRCPVEEIAKVEMNKGVVTVRRKDAKDGFLGIGASGIFRFNYPDLANGRMFLMLLDQLVGIQ